ncbi:MAG: 50S ribosomal protein L19 [Verrucomicrobia bacterium]|nr:50S ribosomal protein L19 [Verrucomicrobiota bacterium]
MKQCQIIQEIEAVHLKKSVPTFRVGDTVNVHMRIIEGEKERIQMFSGTVIARKGTGLSETFSLYRFSYGAGIERVFLVHSPKISKIEVVKTGKVRKSKLYYLRGSSGRASKVKEHIGGKEAAKAQPVEAEPAS